jgi:glycine/D-amino acid oxidase-like deaminating enzyme
MLLEGQGWGWGASGRNPGFQWLHTRKAGLQMELGLAGRRLSDRLAEELDDFEFRRSGGMIYYFEESQEPLMESFVAERREAGLPMELIDGTAARRHCPALSEKVLGASFNPLDAHQDTRRLVESLARAAERAGAILREGVQADSLLVEKGRVVGVRVRGPLIPRSDRRARDRRLDSQAARAAWHQRADHGDAPAGDRNRTCSVPVRAAALWSDRAEAIRIHSRSSGYSEEGTTHPLEAKYPGIEFLELAAQRADGRVLLGCPMDFVGLDDRPTVGGIGLTLAILAERMPSIAKLAVERVWAGLLPQTPDALPILGPVPGLDGLLLNAGHVFGNVAGPISGLMIAQSLAGEKTEFDLGLFSLGRDGLKADNEQHRRW